MRTVAPEKAFVIEMEWHRPRPVERWTISSESDASVWFAQLVDRFEAMGLRRVTLIRPDGTFSRCD